MSLPIEYYLYLAQVIYLYSLRVFFIYSTPYYLLCYTYDPFCCPLNSPSCYNSQASTYRTDPNISDQATPEASTTVNTAADLARLHNEGQLLSSKELKELNTRVKALEEIAKLED